MGANFNFNKVILGGRLTQDIELKQTTSGISVSSFSIAVNRKVASGQEQKTDFFNCTAWRQTAEFISRYFKKGSSICIVGHIENSEWTDNNGNKRYKTEVIVDEAMFVDSKNETQGADGFTPPVVPKFEEITDEMLPF